MPVDTNETEHLPSHHFNCMPFATSGLLRLAKRVRPCSKREEHVYIVGTADQAPIRQFSAISHGTAPNLAKYGSRLFVDGGQVILLAKLQASSDTVVRRIS